MIPDPILNEDLMTDWTPPPLPAREAITGKHVHVEPLSAAKHGDDLFAAFSEDADGALWTYRFHGPFQDRAVFDAWMADCEASTSPLYFAYVDVASGKALGNGSYLEMAPAGGSIEVGYIAFSPPMQRTRMATEAMFLKMKHAFDLGYRRYEWTCDPLNAASMGAAQRLGFSYEGIHRNTAVSKGRNRSKAIFAIIADDWPALRAAFAAWLSDENFDEQGAQRSSLSTLTAPLLHARPQTSQAAQHNALGQPLDFNVPDWTPPPWPPREPMQGRYCRVEPLDIDRHAVDLFTANDSFENWAYLPYGPYDRVEEYANALRALFGGDDPMAHAVIVDGKAVGVATYLRINPSAGSIEVGHINYSPALQRTPAATEAMHLMMARAFDLGYRRYEWKCNAANAPSRNAALRLGFQFESVSRRLTFSKGRNRDTAWFSILEDEWPAISAAHRGWLDPANFEADGQQKRSLREIIDG